MNQIIYLDHNSTTFMLPTAISAMAEQQLVPSNPSAIHHYGRKAKMIMNKTREDIGDLLGLNNVLRNYNVTFTSSCTEANCLLLNNFKQDIVYASNIEHASIYNQDCPINYIFVQTDGEIDTQKLSHDIQQVIKINPGSKILISCMLANNETGLILPIAKIAKIAKSFGAFIHSDFTQAIGKMDVSEISPLLDFITISGHKFGAGLGSGALIARAGIELKPMIYGGGQEKSLRSGTENVGAIAALGAACRYVIKNISPNKSNMQFLQQYLEEELLSIDNKISIIHKNKPRLANTTMLTYPDKSGETSVIALDLAGIAVSNGSACSSGKSNGSKSLKAMGYSESECLSALRISTSWQTSKDDIDKFLTEYKKIISN